MSDLADLEIFSKVVSLRSMSAAARELGLSPAVVSKRINRLETRLGARLLQRTTRQISVTEVGQGFHDRITSILAGVEEAQSYVSGRSSELVGTLRVSAPTSFGRLHIAPHLPAFMTVHPHLSLDLELSDEFVDVIAAGFDLAIRISELRNSSMVARKLAPARRILCASPRYIERFGTPATIEELSRHQCLPAHNSDPWRLEGPSGSLVYRPQGRLNTNSSEVVRELTIAGFGIALRSTWDIGAELRSGQLVQVLHAYESSKNTSISAIFPSRNYLPAKVRAFIDFLTGLYGEEPPWESGL